MWPSEDLPKFNNIIFKFGIRQFSQSGLYSHIWGMRCPQLGDTPTLKANYRKHKTSDSNTTWWEELTVEQFKWILFKCV